jgi:hypothetical protein
LAEEPESNRLPITVAPTAALRQSMQPKGDRQRRTKYGLEEKNCQKVSVLEYLLRTVTKEKTFSEFFWT